ncbi:MAG: hypothetical protein U0797_24125 [Gemmataceae bacterium]
MYRRATILILTVAGAVTAAPVPRYKPAPPAAPAAGEYVLTWASIETRISLKADGGYLAEWGGRPWQGTWYWDARTRTLHVQESCNGHTWSDWSVQLNERLTGAALFGTNRATVTLRAVRDQRRPEEAVALAR